MVALRDGRRATVRPIRAADADELQEAIRSSPVDRLCRAAAHCCLPRPSSASPSQQSSATSTAPGSAA